MSAVVTAASSRQAGRERKTTATRIVVSAFGVLAALAGVEHGVGEILQGPVRPSSVVVESWPDTAGFEILSGEPAMTLVPDMAVTGVLAIIAALAVGVWAVWFIQRPHGGLILIALSVFLLVAGGGFGPPMLAAIIGVAATRIGKQRRTEPGSLGSAVAEAWPWLLGAGLVPGMVVVSRVTGFDNPYLVSRLMFVAFAGLILSLVAARMHDQLTAGRSS